VPAAPEGRFASCKLVSISKSHDWPARWELVRLASAESGKPLYTAMSATGRASARRSDRTDARYPQARKAPTRSIFKRAHVRQPRTTAVNPACGCSRDRNEEQDSGLRRSSVERNKEGDGFVRFRWGEVKKQEADSGARLMIETGAEFPIGPTLFRLQLLPGEKRTASVGKRHVGVWKRHTAGVPGSSGVLRPEPAVSATMRPPGTDSGLNSRPRFPS